MITVTVDASLYEFKRKPNNLGLVSNNLNNQGNQFNVELDTLIELIGKGITLVPSWYSGKRHSSNFDKTNSVFLDIDDVNQTPTQSIEKLSKIGVDVNVYYYTFGYSKSKNSKHRIVILFDDYITDIVTFKAIAKTLIEVVGSDKACSDPCRIFLSTSKPEYVSRETSRRNDLRKLISSPKFTRNVELAKKESRANSQIKGIVSPNNEYVDSIKQRIEKFVDTNNTRKVENVYKKLCNIALFSDFILEGKKMKHSDLFIIASNLRFLPRGKKVFNKQMNLYDYTNSEKNLLKICEAYNYIPNNIDEIGTNALEYLLKGNNFFVTDFTPYQYISLSQAENLLKESFSAAMKNKSNVTIIDAETGLGKTQMLIRNVIDGSLIGSAIAFPTHNLKRQVYEDIQQYIDQNDLNMTVHDFISVTPEIPTFQDRTINENIKVAYSLHSQKDVSYTLRNPKNLSKFTNKPVSQYDMDLANEYVTALDRALSDTSKVLLTTHARAVMDNMEHKKVIFDEDPFEAIANVATISSEFVSLITNVSKKFKKNNTIENRILKCLESLKENSLVLQKLRVRREQLRKSSVDVSLLSRLEILLNSEVIIDNEGFSTSGGYLCSKPRHLNKKKKYVIMTATPTYYYYDNRYKTNKFYINRTKHVGEVKQKADRSYSRGFCLDYENRAHLNSVLGRPGRPAITYKAMAKYTVCDDIYFGNCSGYNDLKGRNIAVVGTPHKPANVYLLSAIISGLEVGVNDAKPIRMTVKHNGQQTIMSSFKNSELRIIQLSDIEKELLQAHGRARTIRNKCEVEIYTNFPLPNYISRDITVEGCRIATIN